MEEKIIVEEIPGVLKLFNDGSVERIVVGNPLALSVPPSNHTFVNGVATRDVLVNDQPRVWVRIYLPEKKKPSDSEKLPLVIHFHGGGFSFSHANWQMYYSFYSRLAKESQVVIVSVEYRLAPEHRLPAACEDCHAVLDWIRTLARVKEIKEEWLTEHADFGRCFLMGESAGGNLVHQTALAYCGAAATENDTSLCLRGSIIIHPGFLRRERSRSETESIPKSPFLTIEMIDTVLKVSLPEGSNRDHPVFNPMGPQAPRVEGLKLPKMLVAIADGDLMRDTQKEFCEAMINAGHSVEVIVSDNVEHYFHVNEFAIAEDANTARQTSNLLAAVDRFIKNC